MVHEIIDNISDATQNARLVGDVLQVEKYPLVLHCPRCLCVQIRIEHFDNLPDAWAECAYCGFGKSHGSDKETAIARFRGAILTAQKGF